MPRTRKPDSELTPKKLAARQRLEAWRARMTPEVKEAYRIKSNAAARAIYRSMEPERKAAFIRDKSLRAKERIKNFTPERLIEHRKMLKEGRRNWRKNLSPEQKAAYKKLDAAYHRDLYSKLSPEVKNKRRKTHQAVNRVNLPPSELGKHCPLLGAEFFRQHPDIADLCRKKIKMGRKIRELAKHAKTKKT